MYNGAAILENNPKRLSIELSSDPEIPLLSTYPRETKVYVHKNLVHKCVPGSFINNSQNWEQPKRPSIDEMIKLW